MAKTIEQKLTDRLDRILESTLGRRDSARLHIVVRGGRLRFATTNSFCTGDIYVLKARNQHGNILSKPIISLRVEILKTHIALNPLLKKQTMRG